MATEKSLESVQQCPLCENTELEPCGIYAGKPVELSSLSRGISFRYDPGTALFRCGGCRLVVPEEILVVGRELKVVDLPRHQKTLETSQL